MVIKVFYATEINVTEQEYISILYIIP